MWHIRFHEWSIANHLTVYSLAGLGAPPRRTGADLRISLAVGQSLETASGAPARDGHAKELATPTAPPLDQILQMGLGFWSSKILCSGLSFSSWATSCMTGILSRHARFWPRPTPLCYGCPYRPRYQNAAQSFPMGGKKAPLRAPSPRVVNDK